MNHVRAPLPRWDSLTIRFCGFCRFYGSTRSCPSETLLICAICGQPPLLPVSNPWNSVIENASPFDIRNSLFDVRHSAPLSSAVPLTFSSDSGCEKLSQLVPNDRSPFLCNFHFKLCATNGRVTSDCFDRHIAASLNS